MSILDNEGHDPQGFGNTPNYKPIRHEPSWSVTVERDGEQVVTIGHNHLSGRELSAADEETICSAAMHLLSFIGKPCGVQQQTQPTEKP